MCSWGLPHDAMHDLFEGLVQYEIKVLLLHCIQRKYFSLSTFNNLLLSFQYGYSEIPDKATPITTHHLNSKEGKHLRQGAAQSWLLLRIMPTLIGQYVPESDDHWCCFLKLVMLFVLLLYQLTCVPCSRF